MTTDNYLTLSDLKRYGFTDKMVRDLVKEPPILRRNPMYKCGPEMKLWDKEYIERIMCSSEFAEAKAKADKRRQSARKACNTKLNSTDSEITKAIEDIKVKVISDEELVKVTLNDKGIILGQSLYEEINEATMQRWIVNYIRHCLTEYNEVLWALKGKVGKKSAYLKYRKAVLDKIKDAYPKYAAECDRQYERQCYIS